MQVKSESLKRTKYGVIESFDKIFTNARYLKRQYCPIRGSWCDSKPGEIFLNTSGRELPASFTDSHRYCLYCTPIEPMEWFSPIIGSYQSGVVGPSSIKIIPWYSQLAYLVLACDPNHIRDVWLGFVPMGQTFEASGP